MKYLPLLLCLLASCVMPSDLRAVAAAQEEYQLNVGDTLDELRRNAITYEEAERQNEASLDAFRDEVEDTIEEVETRTANLVEGASQIPTDPASLIAYLATLGITVYSSVKTTNTLRDKRRKKRKEPVAVPDEA